MHSWEIEWQKFEFREFKILRCWVGNQIWLTSFSCFQTDLPNELCRKIPKSYYIVDHNKGFFFNLASSLTVMFSFWVNTILFFRNITMFTIMINSSAVMTIMTRYVQCRRRQMPPWYQHKKLPALIHSSHCSGGGDHYGDEDLLFGHICKLTGISTGRKSMGQALTAWRSIHL